MLLRMLERKFRHSQESVHQRNRRCRNLVGQGRRGFGCQQLESDLGALSEFMGFAAEQSRYGL